MKRPNFQAIYRVGAAVSDDYPTIPADPANRNVVIGSPIDISQGATEPDYITIEFTEYDGDSADCALYRTQPDAANSANAILFFSGTSATPIVFRESGPIMLSQGIGPLSGLYAVFGMECTVIIRSYNFDD